MAACVTSFYSQCHGAIVVPATSRHAHSPNTLNSSIRSRHLRLFNIFWVISLDWLINRINIKRTHVQSQTVCFNGNRANIGSASWTTVNFWRRRNRNSQPECPTSFVTFVSNCRPTTEPSSALTSYMYGNRCTILYLCDCELQRLECCSCQIHHSATVRQDFTQLRDLWSAAGHAWVEWVYRRL